MEITKNNYMEKIKESRPNLKDNTIKQYEVHLNRLKKIFDTDNFDFLSNVDDVMEKLKNNHYTSQRNTLNAIIVLLLALNIKNEYDNLISQYQSLRDKFNEKYVEDQLSGKISEKQKDNFVSLEEIQAMLNKMKKEITTQNLKKKENLTPKDKELLMVYMIFSFMVKYPLRNDLAMMKYISKSEYNKLTLEEKKKQNFLVNDKNNLKVVMNEYKTSRKYGEKTFNLDGDIKRIVRMFIRLTDVKVGDYLLISGKGNPISKNYFTQLLVRTSQKYLDKNISSTMLRKIVVSDKFGSLKKDQKEMADIMGHDVATQNLVYVKEK